MHCILPPFMPHVSASLPTHFPHSSWYPYQYVRLCLLEAPHYSLLYPEALRLGAQSHQLLANWQATDFAAMVVDGIPFRFDGKPPLASTSNILKQDQTSLSNHGRPHSDCAPSLTYYGHAKVPGELTKWH
eukprot:NODE_7183_length_459_cov_2.563253_g7017_i0.p1 GENE.NODE_7183_length_459_cov_2.563253_g7017_i0~~NODE_7183_length_459_cov_2.563253_g7017_i0.p1  ORF type:complete len:143 (+),score=30.13 NODE_7183_length_459_cov_2.563253_g7017_i0:41-430(+)